MPRARGCAPGAGPVVTSSARSSASVRRGMIEIRVDVKLTLAFAAGVAMLEQVPPLSACALTAPKRPISGLERRNGNTSTRANACIRCCEASETGQKPVQQSTSAPPGAKPCWEQYLPPGHSPKPKSMRVPCTNYCLAVCGCVAPASEARGAGNGTCVASSSDTSERNLILSGARVTPILKV